MVAAVLAIAYLAMARLPESFVSQLARTRPLPSNEADWAYRLLAIAAFAQAVYGGFVLLHSERVHQHRTTDERVAALPRERVLALVVRNAAVLVLLTFIYGIAAFVITGQRGGFWLFALLSLLQGAWYVRQVNVVARYLDFQKDPEPARPSSAWKEPPPDYTPPLARGLQTSPEREPAG